MSDISSENSQQEINQFTKKIESILKKEKKSLVARETLVNILRSIPPILAPWTSRGLEYLAGYTSITAGSQYLNETKNFTEEAEYRTIGNKLFITFTEEINKTMPEIEREAKSPDFLKSSLQRLSNNSIRFIRAKTQFKGGFFGIGISLAAMGISSLPIIATGGLMAGMTALGITTGIATTAGLATYITTHSTLKKRRERLKNANSELIEAYSQTEKAKISALSNTALRTMTYSDNKQIKELEKKFTNEDNVYKKFISFIKNSVGQISLTNLAINIGILGGCWAIGMPVITLAGVYMGINVMNGSIRSMQDSWFRIRESSDIMYEQYKKIQHNKIYDLEYGTKKISQTANAIQLQNICYAHRYNGEDTQRIGKRTDIPLFQSASTITFQPGINVIGGASGAGKSTFYKLLRHADDLNYGSISYGRVTTSSKFEGVKTTEVSKDEIGKHIAFCFQEIENTGQTGLDIIQSGNPYMKIEHIEKAAANLELGLYKETNDKGREPKLFSEMSGGEKKRILFLQAFLSPKRFLVFDEPTSGVDPSTAEKMLEMLNDDYIQINEKKEKRTILYTTHNPDDLQKLNIVQVVDMAPVQNPKKIEEFIQKHGIAKLPTDLTIYPFETSQEKQLYIDLVKSRHSEKGSPSSATKHNIQSLISLSFAARIEQENQEEKTSISPLGNLPPTPFKSELKWGKLGGR